jgi:hypothetical protein
MKMSRLERTVAALKSAGTSVVAVAKAAPAVIAGAVARVSDPEFREAAMLDLELLRDVARGKVAERYRPLVKKLLARAYWENNPEAPVADETPLAAE